VLFLEKTVSFPAPVIMTTRVRGDLNPSFPEKY